MLYENYACGGVGNYNGYCNPEIDKLIDQQSIEPDQEKRKQLVWEIETQAGRGRRPADHLLHPRRRPAGSRRSRA